MLSLLSFLRALIVLWFPMPKPPKMPVLDVSPLRSPPPEPEFEFDPLAFWLFPDWDGPLKQPFWMRPLRKPPRPVSRETSDLTIPLLYGTRHIGGMLMWYGDQEARRLVRKPSAPVEWEGARLASVMRSVGPDEQVNIEVVEADGEHRIIAGLSREEAAALAAAHGLNLPLD